MSNLNKVDVPIAVTHKTKLDLSCESLSSQGFMTPLPVFYRHMIRGEHLNLTADSLVRPAPIEVPFFGTIKQNLRHFFVPYRIVFPNWDSFYNDTIASNVNRSSLVSSPPIVTAQTIHELFTDSIHHLSDVGSAASYDFIDSGNYYKYTYLGRVFIKFLNSLGYEHIIPSTKEDDIPFNALGLLAFVKVYVDWYANSQYLNSSDVLLFERILHFNDPTSNLILSKSDLWSLFSLLRSAVYDTEDYFVNAWDNPVSPVSGQYSSFSFLDPTSNNGTYVSTNSIGSPEMYQQLDNQSVGTTYLHDALKKLSDFQKRHALAGARSIDRVLAQYGLISDNLRQDRSVYLGSNSSLIEIGSVYATADSSDNNESSRVGDYAGAGRINLNASLDYVSSEEGVLISISTIIPSGHIVQGYDRNNRHISKFDFFVPEFDSLGVQAIEKGEVYVSPSSTFASRASDYAGVFGFTGRYGEYKRPRSFVVGDLRRLNSISGISSWSVNRYFSDGSFSDVTGLVHSLQFTRGLDAQQYNRVFQYTHGDYDPFYNFIRFKIGSYVPARPLFESYQFDSDSKKVPTENGNKVN